MTALLALIPGGSTLTKVIVVLALLSAITVAGGVSYHHIWSNGYDRAITDIAMQDSKATATARQRRAAVRECAAGGMQWDQSTGKCGRR